MDTLKTIFDKHQCDKGTMKHRYDRVYAPVLSPMRQLRLNILEIGIFKGVSLKSWLEFFPNANIFGIDIFSRVKPKDIPVLNNPRVSWCVCDSVKGPTETFVDMAKSGFDVIIDDGLHTPDAQRKTFENFIPFLNSNGKYFIEDVWPYDKMTTQQKKHSWLTKHSKDFSNKQHDALLNALSVYKYTYHDLREGYDPDTFIIEITK